MPAPTLIQYAETTWSGSGAKNATGVGWNSGDLIAVIVGTETGSTGAGAPPTNANLTFTAGTAIGADSTHCWANSYTATAATTQAAQTIANAGAAGSADWGMAVWVLRGHNGFTRAALADATKVVSLTRAAGNSLVLGGFFDFLAAASTGYSFTPAVANDRQHAQDGTHYTVYVADWGDQGAAGTTSYGTTGETSAGPFSKIAIEVKGIAAAGGAAPVPVVSPSAAVMRAATW